MQLPALQLARGRELEGAPRGAALAPAWHPGPPWLFVTSVVALGGWTRREGRCCPLPARPVPHWDPSITQMGAVTPRLVPVQHHSWLNEISSERTCSHTNPSQPPGCAQFLQPLPSLPPWGTGTGTGVPGDTGQLCLPCPSTGVGHQPCFHHRDHSLAL